MRRGKTLENKNLKGFFFHEFYQIPSKHKTDIFVTTYMVLIATRKPTYIQRKQKYPMQKTSCPSDKPTVSLLETISGKKETPLCT